MTAIHTINVHELNQLMKENKSLCLIDVREPDEWQEGHIPGALHLPRSQLPSLIRAHVSDLQTPIYLYCRGGVRSLYAAQALADLGFKELYSIDGGIMEWQSAGYTVVSE
ncbi:MAG: sulfurtransferase [Legionella sp.]|nr:MAG: sulfurtransferase [Legionella sp.]PJD99687.1 MAG: sulfurtransferase [Legionella sp.]